MDKAFSQTGMAFCFEKIKTVAIMLIGTYTLVTGNGNSIDWHIT